MSEASTVSCPHCGGKIRNDPQLAGKQVACPLCKRLFVLPAIPILPQAQPLAPAQSSVSCPHCNGQIAADPSIAGKEVGCPHCNGRVMMPGAVAAQAPPPLPASPIGDEPAPFDFLESSTPSGAPSHSTTAAYLVGHKKSGVPVGVWIGLGIFGFMVLMCCGGIATLSNHGGGGGGVGRGGGGEGGGGVCRGGDEEGGGDVVRGGGVMTREQFRRAVIGKTQDQVIRAVGRPATTAEAADQTGWYYQGRTKDPVTGKLDTATAVGFEGGVATGVTFVP